MGWFIFILSFLVNKSKKKKKTNKKNKKKKHVQICIFRFLKIVSQVAPFHTTVLGALWFRKLSVDFRRFRVFVFYHKAHSKTRNLQKILFLFVLTLLMFLLVWLSVWSVLWNFLSFLWFPVFPTIPGNWFCPLIW